jgi:hypothetical protein
VDITFSDRGEFAQLASRFRAHRNGAVIRKALTTAIQAELKTVVYDIQREARGMNVKGSRGRGSRSRARFDLAKEMRRASVAAAKGKKVRARRGSISTGLRERVAHSVKSKVQYTGFRLGAKVYVETSNFPHSQRKLPRDLNRAGGWRHPTWGHRDRWVQQVGEPYFDRPVLRHRDRIRKSVAGAVSQALRSLQ